MSKTITEDVGHRIEALAAQINAATAELVQLSAEYDDVGGWLGVGLRSCAHWLSIHAGVDVRTGEEMVRTGHALEALPQIAEAFADGRLSFDKVRQVTRVPVSADEQVWLEVALNVSGGQLSRICRAVSSAIDASDPHLSENALQRRSVRMWWRDDGMLQVTAVVSREDGAVVRAAVEAAAAALVSELRSASRAGGRVDDPAGLTPEVLRADALVDVCEEWVASVSATPTPAPTRQVVISTSIRQRLSPAILPRAATSKTVHGYRSTLRNGSAATPTSSPFSSATARYWMSVASIACCHPACVSHCRFAIGGAVIQDAVFRRHAPRDTTSSTGFRAVGPAWTTSCFANPTPCIGQATRGVDRTNITSVSPLAVGSVVIRLSDLGSSASRSSARFAPMGLEDTTGLSRHWDT